jgi:SOS-response transcriptional repressor LexA
MSRAPGSYVGLTTKQAELLSYIRTRQSAGETPSYEEMVDALDLRTKSAVSRLIASLEYRGYITRHAGMARSIIALEHADVPALRNFAAGQLLDELRRRGMQVAVA